MSFPTANARAETARASDGGVVVGVDADVVERVPERLPELAGHAGVQLPAAAARRRDRGLHVRMDEAAGQNPLAVMHARDKLREPTIAHISRGALRPALALAVRPPASPSD